ncbi:HAAS signaling domain-containing protein [Mobilicoccus massiliensis]|uniref:HAAS signaling domain-containing protein n=1 Tax=Mobilicoccus massiliensis TaxID=1522310 RepID=UPI00059088C4|nr:hypothetical protein [Mobilicoccus massiliensis]
MTATAHRLTVAYLDRLQTAARVLPVDAAADLLADIGEHLDVALADVDPESPGAEARVRDVLDRLGEPADLVADAMPESAGVVPGGATGADLGRGRETSLGAAIAAVALLLAAGLVAVMWPAALVAWVVGLVLFVRSSLWRTIEKALGGAVLASAFPLGLLLWNAAGLAFVEGGATGDDCVVGSAQPCAPSVSPPASELWFGAVVLVVPVVLQLVTAGILVARARRRARAQVASSRRSRPRR